MEIEMRGINKSFGDNAVLKNAGFLLSTGEIHALMGENGAGKSTLMKILTGVYTKDAGQVIVDGKEVCYKNAREAEKGIERIVRSYRRRKYVSRERTQKEMRCMRQNNNASGSGKDFGTSWSRD